MPDKLTQRQLHALANLYTRGILFAKITESKSILESAVLLFNASWKRTLNLLMSTVRKM